MLRSNKDKQTAYEFVSIEQLVPQDHMLQEIDTYINFSFILEKVRPYYCEDNGRPTIDPLVLFNMMFFGYFYGIRSERHLEQEIQTNVAYRWFLGFGLTDRVPDHTTISLNRRVRWYRHYKSVPEVSKSCTFLSRCPDPKKHRKVTTRHVWEDSKDWVRENRLSKAGKKLYKKRKETIERSFADAKQLHGFRYYRLLGLRDGASADDRSGENMKKIALHLAKQG